MYLSSCGLNTHSHHSQDQPRSIQGHVDKLMLYLQIMCRLSDVSIATEELDIIHILLSPISPNMNAEQWLLQREM